MVKREFADSPGRCDNFNFPVTPEQARAALDDVHQHLARKTGTEMAAIRQRAEGLKRKLTAETFL